MPTKTKLRILLESTKAPVALEVRQSRVVIKSLGGEVRGAWLEEAAKHMPRSQIGPDELKVLLEKVDVRCESPYTGARPTLLIGGTVSLYIDTRAGQKAFWIDTVTAIITEVTL